MSEDPTLFISQRIKQERENRAWSLSELAVLSGVSKAMISKIERAETSPTAVILGKLSAAFKLTLSALLARSEQHNNRLVRSDDQPLWTDPETGYLRRQVSSVPDSPTELTKVDLPAGAKVTYPASSLVFLRQSIWMLKGTLIFTEGSISQTLEEGDSYALGEPQDISFFNDTETGCSYLVVVVRQ